MARKLDRNPAEPVAYLIDANFLANRFIPAAKVTDVRERQRVERSMEWWQILDAQMKAGQAKIYVPDVCIAEAFKVIAKKYYKDKYFSTTVAFKNARDRLSKFVRTPSKDLSRAGRSVAVHDISTSRDVIIAVDRFFESIFKNDLNVSVVDLIILATAKYLSDFFGVAPIYIVTLDRQLWRASKKLQDVPSAFNPADDSDLARKVFGVGG